MVHLARAGGPHPISYLSLRDALFAPGRPPARRAGRRSARTRSTGTTRRTARPRRRCSRRTGWTWHQPATSVTAPTWGGNLEVLHWNSGRGPVDPPGRGLRRLRAAAGDLRGDCRRHRGLPDAAQCGRARRCSASSRRCWSAGRKAAHLRPSARAPRNGSRTGRTSAPRCCARSPSTTRTR